MYWLKPLDPVCCTVLAGANVERIGSLPGGKLNWLVELDCNSHKSSPLHVACFHGHLEVVKLLAAPTFKVRPAQLNHALHYVFSRTRHFIDAMIVQRLCDRYSMDTALVPLRSTSSSVVLTKRKGGVPACISRRKAIQAEAGLGISTAAIAQGHPSRGRLGNKHSRHCARPSKQRQAWRKAIQAEAGLGISTAAIVGLLGTGVAAFAASASSPNPRALVSSGMAKFRENDVEGSVGDFDAAMSATPSMRPYLWQRGLSL
eukprot:gene31848-7054_t